MAQERYKVFVVRSDYPEGSIDLLKEKCDLDIWDSSEGNISDEEFLRRVSGIDAILVSPPRKIDENVVRAAGKSLKVISTVSVGLDHIDLDAMKKHSIKIGYTPGTLTEAVAELTLCLTLMTARRAIEANKVISRNEWKWAPLWLCGTGLLGSTVGIVGFGRIGQSVAKKLIPFDVSKILYTGPRKKPEADSLGAVFATLDDLLKESDFVIVTCPLTTDTERMFTTEKFSLMKRSAIFINTSRGALVDQDALVYALENNIIKAAGLDVMTPEPLPPDHPLVKLDNCVLLPHIGSATVQTRQNMWSLTAKNILSALENKDMPAEYKL